MLEFVGAQPDAGLYEQELELGWPVPSDDELPIELERDRALLESAGRLPV